MGRLNDLQLASFLVLLAFANWWFFRRLTNAVHAGDAWRAVRTVWYVSPVTLVLLAWLGENRDVTDFLHWGVMPWSLVIGDTVVLPAAAAIAARSQAWRQDPLSAVDGPARWETSLAWWTFSRLIGFAAGIGFHVKDSQGYEALGAGDLVACITKLIHDLMIYPVLFGALWYVGVPLVIYAWAYRWWFLGCIGLWVILVVCDMNRGLDPHDFATTCDALCSMHNLAGHGHDVLDWVRSFFPALYLK